MTTRLDDGRDAGWMEVMMMMVMIRGPRTNSVEQARRSQ